MPPLDDPLDMPLEELLPTELEDEPDEWLPTEPDEELVVPLVPLVGLDDDLPLVEPDAELDALLPPLELGVDWPFAEPDEEPAVPLVELPLAAPDAPLLAEPVDGLLLVKEPLRLDVLGVVLAPLWPVPAAAPPEAAVPLPVVPPGFAAPVAAPPAVPLPEAGRDVGAGATPLEMMPDLIELDLPYKAAAPAAAYKNVGSYSSPLSSQRLSLLSSAQ